MLKRTLTGACLVAVVVGFFLLRNYVDTRLFHILIAIFCALGTFELMRALGDRAACMPYVMIYGVGVIPAYVLGGVAAAAVVFGLFAVSFCLLCLLDRTMKAKQLFLTLFAMVYPSFFLVAMAAVNDMGGNGYFALLLIFLVSPAADTFAYLVGSLLKGPKLCPKLSPNKTISGAIGGVVGALLTSILIGVVAYLVAGEARPLLPAWYVYLILGILGGVVGEMGDLFFSLVKRHCGMKDFSNLFPGHGGMLDRLDSVLFMAVLMLCYRLMAGI